MNSNKNIPQLRFPRFSGEWEEKVMSDVFTRRTEKNAEDNKNVLTISAQYGLISQLEFFKKSVSAADVTGYYLLHKGDFAYNKSSSQGKSLTNDILSWKNDLCFNFGTQIYKFNMV